MIISMALHASKEQTEQVCERIRELGYKVHSIQGEERVVIGAVGIGDVTGCLEQLEAMPGVESAVRISAPYKFVSKEFRAARTRVRVDGTEIGGDEFVVIAGPCCRGAAGRAHGDRPTPCAKWRSGRSAARRRLQAPHQPLRFSRDWEKKGLENSWPMPAEEPAWQSSPKWLAPGQTSTWLPNTSDMLQIGARNMQNFAARGGRPNEPGPAQAWHQRDRRGVAAAAEYILRTATPT